LHEKKRKRRFGAPEAGPDCRSPDHSKAPARTLIFTPIRQIVNGLTGFADYKQVRLRSMSVMMRIRRRKPEVRAIEEDEDDGFFAQMAAGFEGSSREEETEVGRRTDTADSPIGRARRKPSTGGRRLAICRMVTPEAAGRLSPNGRLQLDFEMFERSECPLEWVCSLGPHLISGEGLAGRRRVIQFDDRHRGQGPFDHLPVITGGEKHQNRRPRNSHPGISAHERPRARRISNIPFDR